MPASRPALPAVSIIIVSYNTRALTCDCLASLKAETPDLGAEIIVVDNASSDGSADAIASAHPDVELIALDENIGFARANNLASRQARGEFILLLNPDTLVQNRAVEKLIDFARCCPHAGIWGGRTVFADGTLNPSSCWGRMTLWNLACRATGLAAIFKTSALFNTESYGGWQRDTARDVDIVSGCFLLISRALWNKLGGFEPEYFMYGEDADLSLRARRKGYRPMITPQAQIVHYGGASERVRSDKMVRLLAAKAMLIRAHMPQWQHRFAIPLLAAWPLSRLIAHACAGLLLGGKQRENADTWQQVWLRRREWINGFGSAANAEKAAPNRHPTSTGRPQSASPVTP